MNTVYGVHWTNGFGRVEVELFNALDEAKNYKEAVSTRWIPEFNHFVPIEVICDEDRMLKVIYNNLTTVLECSSENRDSYDYDLDDLVRSYINQKKIGYELLYKHYMKELAGDIEPTFDEIIEDLKQTVKNEWNEYDAAMKRGEEADLDIEYFIAKDQLEELGITFDPRKD